MTKLPSSPFDWIASSMQALEADHLRRRLADRQSDQAGYVTINERRFLNFGSNDYLGLARDPRLAEAASEAAKQYGWGSGASPLITGHSGLHRALEDALAKWEETEAALLFPTGFAANVGVITALADKSSIIFSDAKNHASIIDGCRLSGAQVVVYGHNDMEELATRLNKGQRKPQTVDRQRRLIQHGRRCRAGG